MSVPLRLFWCAALLASCGLPLEDAPEDSVRRTLIGTEPPRFDGPINTFRHLPLRLTAESGLDLAGWQVRLFDSRGAQLLGGPARELMDGFEVVVPKADDHVVLTVKPRRGAERRYPLAVTADAIEAFEIGAAQ